MTDLEPEHLRKVFVGGLHPDTTDESMRTYFCKYGEIVDVIVMKDSQTRRSRGFGFVAFDKSECVDALQNERPHALDGKTVDTKRVVPKQSSSSRGRSESEQKVNKVFLGGLKEDITEEDIKQFFGRFGQVERVETFTDKATNRRKGFGFVTFQDFDSVDKCVLTAETAPDRKINLQGHKIEVKKAKSQDEMNGMRGDRGGSRGGGGGNRFGSRGGGGGFGDFGNQGYNNNMNQGFSAGYNQGGGGGYAQGGGGGGYNQGSGGSFNQGGFNNGYNQGGGGGGGSYGGGDGCNSGSGGWNQQQQQQPQQGSGYSNNSSGGGYGSSGGMGSFGSSGGSGGSGSGGYSGNSGGGGPMRGGFNKGTNRSGPYGGGNSGWRN